MNRAQMMDQFAAAVRLFAQSLGEEQAMMVTLAGVIIVLAIIVNMLSEFFDTIRVFVSL